MSAMLRLRNLYQRIWTLHRSSELLLEKEKISREEFESLFEDKPYGESL